MSAFELTELVIIKFLSRLSLCWSIFVMSLIGGKLTDVCSNNCEFVVIIVNL